MMQDFKIATLGIFLLVSVLTVVPACGGPNGDADAGARWYSMYNCSACHGLNGNDGRAAPVAGLSMSFRSFLKVLRKPASASMPPYPEEKVSREDAADIYTWLKSLKKG